MAFDAMRFTCWPSASPLAFAPPMDRTGIVNGVWERRAKSVAVSGNDAK